MVAAFSLGPAFSLSEGMLQPLQYGGWGARKIAPDMQALPAARIGTGDGGFVGRIVTYEQRQAPGKSGLAHETVQRASLAGAAHADFQRLMRRLQLQRGV